jgi:hypothetical protein
MSARWYVVKHVPDLIRLEPDNIGVILVMDGVGVSRFLGEQEDGDIDGRTVPQFGNHLVYKAWVKHWRALSRQDEELREQAAAGRPAGSSFYIENAGGLLTGDIERSADEMLDELFATLVRPDTERADDDLGTMTRKLIRRVGIARAVKERVRLEVTVNGLPDDLWFDYRYDNGQPHLMQRVGLASSDKATWDRLHLVEVNFERLIQSRAFPEFTAITFVKQQNADPRLVDAVHGRLGELARIVDVSNQETAAGQLKQLLHL